MKFNRIANQKLSAFHSVCVFPARHFSIGRPFWIHLHSPNRIPYEDKKKTTSSLSHTHLHTADIFRKQHFLVYRLHIIFKIGLDSAPCQQQVCGICVCRLLLKHIGLYFFALFSIRNSETGLQLVLIILNKSNKRFNTCLICCSIHEKKT